MRYISDIISAVKVEQARIAESLTAGNVVNFETYQRLVGQYQGLVKSLEIIETLLWFGSNVIVNTPTNLRSEVISRLEGVVNG